MLALDLSVGRHDCGGAAQLAVHVPAESFGSLARVEGADAHAIPDALGPEVGLDDIGAQPRGARARFDAVGLRAILRRPDLDGVATELFRWRREGELRGRPGSGLARRDARDLG